MTLRRKKIQFQFVTKQFDHHTYKPLIIIHIKETGARYWEILLLQKIRLQIIKKKQSSRKHK